MQLIAWTALIDGIICLIIHRAVKKREKESDPTSLLHHFEQYFLYLAIFLLILSLTIIYMLNQGASTFTGVALAVGHIVLWFALASFVRIPFQIFFSREAARQWFVIVLVLGLLGSVYEFAGIFSPETLALLPLGFVGTFLSQMPAILMFAVWIPAGVVFLVQGFSASDPLIRTRGFLLAAGLVLTAFSWILRMYVSSINLTVLISVVVVSSLLGFFALARVAKR